MDKSDQITMRDHNQRLVLQALFNAKETSRAQIAVDLNLHKSTISSIYRDLDKLEFIEDLGEGVTTETGGRKAKMIRFNRKYGYVMSFDMGRHHLRMALVRLSGEVIFQSSDSVKDMSVLEVLELMNQHVKDNKHKKHGTKEGLMGIAVGIHGVVDNNRVVYSPFFDYSQVDVAQQLEKVSDVKVTLENEANSAAVYIRDYHDYLSTDQYDSLVALNIHYGIGAGIIIQGQLYRGMQGRAGEVGRSIVNMTNNEPVRVEDLYSEDAMFERLATLTGQKVANRDAFVTFANQKSAVVTKLLDDWVMGVAQVAYNIIQTAAPQVLFIHSRFIAEMPELLGRVIVAYQQMNPTSESEILFANRSVYEATLLGGAAGVTRKILDLDDVDLKFKH
ncbi:ROK family protein [Leuconostoc miyukkimchii]|uniref:ROK family protein n=1 Tax=Leuconostoc miyukkimchii TaxID=910540 RepID=UPI001C7CC23C|nr:ROK family protein [Leuconostoc miyukkimchii]